MKQALIISGLLLAALLFTTGCSRKQAPDWYVVTGTGVMNEGAPASQAKLMAKRAAKTDAQRQLLEAAKGTHISSETTVENFMTQNDYIRSRVEGVIRSAQILDTRFNDDGSCEMDMRIDMNQIREIVR
ncbi:LPP20 family lipoprotein [Candidatus Sumerlaeota bacterium]|nr:LPP20 family lipoprotein [Candidatus Sumerlaeota bacterium]